MPHCVSSTHSDQSGELDSYVSSYATSSRYDALINIVIMCYAKKPKQQFEMSRHVKHCARVSKL